MDIEWARLAVDALRAVAWPAVGLIALLLFRSQLQAGLAAAATRLVRARLPGGLELDFAEALRELDVLDEKAVPVELPAAEVEEPTPALAEAVVVAEYERLQAELRAFFPGYSAADTLSAFVRDLPSRPRQTKLAKSAEILDRVAALARQGDPSITPERAAAFVRLVAMIEHELRTS